MSKKTRKVGIHYDAIHENHDTGPDHPESAERYRVLIAALDKLPKRFQRLEGRDAEVSELLLAHCHNYHDMVYEDVETFAQKLRTGDTAICEESYDIARLATGAVLEACDAVMRGDIASAFCAIRPPGHHATTNQGMGFCIFNHVAIAARYLQQKHGLKKIAIIDWDVHHGNGTEEIFIQDPSVLYVSLHEKDNYPYTGHTNETGIGAGKGFNLNIPLLGNSDGESALAEWDARITPAIDDFKPDFILISAGFDARIDDPIGGLCWTDETFQKMTERCVMHANKHCGGKIVSALEGGYNPAGMASAAVAHVKSLGHEVEEL